MKKIFLLICCFIVATTYSKTSSCTVIKDLTQGTDTLLVISPKNGVTVSCMNNENLRKLIIKAREDSICLAQSDSMITKDSLRVIKETLQDSLAQIYQKKSQKYKNAVDTIKLSNLKLDSINVQKDSIISLYKQDYTACKASKQSAFSKFLYSVSFIAVGFTAGFLFEFFN